MTGLFDTHMHLVYPDIAGYAWTDPIPELARKAFTIADYRALTADLGVDGGLFMETGVDDPDLCAETRFAAEIARDPANGVRGLIASCRPERREGFEAWVEEARMLGAVGFRRILHVVDDALSTSDAFRANIRHLGDVGASFDLCFLARQLPLAAELAAACDATTLILDHCGVPDIAAGALDPWRADLRRIAGLPNVSCKLSGVLAYCAPGSATADAISPYVDHVLECFGPDRILWGSDWPVVDTANGLADWIGVTRRILDRLSPTEAASIAKDTAFRVYGLA